VLVKGDGEKFVRAADTRAWKGAESASLPDVSYFKHDSACVDEGASIGEDTRIWHFCHVSAGARIGRHCVLGQNVYIAPSVIIGDHVHIQNNVSLYDGVTVEDAVFIGPSAVFTNILTPRSEVSRKGEYQATHLRHGATVGANATVLCGRIIGRYALIGAGAVVTADVPDHALMIGVPARRTGWACRCGVRLVWSEDAASCKDCGTRYIIAEERVQRVS